MHAKIILAAFGVTACTFFLSVLTWNWDAQAGCMLFPIGLGYVAFWLVPLMSYCFPKSIDAVRIPSEVWKIRNSLGWIVFLGGLLMIGWALSLPSPTQRKDNIGCYEQVLPYQRQPPCK